MLFRFSSSNSKWKTVNDRGFRNSFRVLETAKDRGIGPKQFNSAEFQHKRKLSKEITGHYCPKRFHIGVKKSIQK